MRLKIGENLGTANFDQFISNDVTIKLYQVKCKSSLFHHRLRLKVSRQETAIRPCGHLGQLHLLAILHSYRHKLKLVIETKKIQNIINNVTGNNNCAASF